MAKIVLGVLALKSNKNKWVVSATTAALVASAIVPVASAANFSDIANNDHKDAILALAEAGIVSGFADGTFKPNASVTRGNVTKLLGKWLVSEGYEIPEDFEKEARFTDLPVNFSDKELVKYAALVKDAKVFNGSNNKLMHTNEMTREQMALVLVRAINTVYGVDLVADYKAAKFESKITDLEKATDVTNREAITALEYAKLTDVTAFNPKNSLTRGQFASFLNRTIVNLAKEEVVLTVKEVTVKDATTLEVTLSDDTKHTVTLPTALEGNKETEVEFEIDGKKYSSKVTYEVLAVASVTAANGTTLTVTGTLLNTLAKEDITVEDNKVKSITASEDGKTLTVALEDSLIVDQKTKVTVKGTDFEVTHSIKATGVTIAEGAIFDNDTEDQYVKLLVDGKEFTALELISAGYSVTFEAFTTKSAKTPASIFASVAGTTSTTGELASLINLTNTVDDYYVRATVTSGSEVIISDLTKIQITNKDIVADGLTSVVLENLGADGTFTDGTDFEQVSSTLVTGEQAQISEITVKSGSKVEVLKAGQFSVKSSNDSVVSADKNNNYKLEAQGPGTATLTISYGGSTFTKTITVQSAARKAASVQVEKTAVTVTETGNTELKVRLLDQYGDPMPFTPNTDLTVVGTDDSIATATLTAPQVASKQLIGKLTITGVDKGSAVFTFRNGADKKLGTTSVRATVTNNTAISQYLLSVDNDITTDDLAEINAGNSLTLTKNDISTDATIDNGDDKYVKILIKGTNNAGQVIVDKPSATTDYQVSGISSSDTDVLDTTFGTDGVAVKDGYLLVKAGKENGSATITISDRNNPSITKTFKVTVTNKGFTVSGVTFKDVLVTYAQKLDFEDFLSYSKSANDYIINGLTLTQSVSQAVRLNGDVLYIDKDGSGTQTTGDVVVGSIVLTTTGTFTNSVSSNALDVVAGDDGTVFFKVLNTGKDKVISADDEVIATKSVKVNF